MIIETDHLNKFYGSHHVIRDVSLRVPRGRLVGFLGPNGAGKTTVIRILTGLLRATSGQARIQGHCVWRFGKLVREEVGYLPGEVRFYERLTGRQTLRFLSAARRRHCEAEVQRLSRRLDLDLDKLVRKYSTGMRQKLGLIQAMMHRPRLLILDEPTSALDPLVRNIVFEELREVVADGRTVLFSSHSLAEVESLCDEVIILRDGQVVEHESITSLRKRAIRRVEISFSKDPPEHFPEGLKPQHGHGRVWRCTWNGPTRDLLKWLAGQPVEDVVIESPDLNDLFLAYYHNPDSPANQTAGETRMEVGTTREYETKRSGVTESDHHGGASS